MESCITNSSSTLNARRVKDDSHIEMMRDIAENMVNGNKMEEMMGKMMEMMTKMNNEMIKLVRNMEKKQRQISKKGLR